MQGLLADDTMIQQMLADPPLPALREVFEVYRKKFSRAGQDSRTTLAKDLGALKRAVVHMLAPGEPIAEDDVQPQIERDLLDLVLEFVPRAQGVKTKHDAHRPPDHVAREFYRGVKGHFAKHGYQRPTATDLADLATACGMEQGPRVYRRWEDRLTAYRREEKARRRNTPDKL